MTVKIKSIGVARMNKGAHSNYMETVLSYLDKYETVKTKVHSRLWKRKTRISKSPRKARIPRKSRIATTCAT